MYQIKSYVEIIKTIKMKANNLKNICNNETFMNLLKLLFHLCCLSHNWMHKSNNSPKKHTKYLINNSFRISEYLSITFLHSLKH